MSQGAKSTMEDLSQTLKNLGGEQGMQLEVKIDNASLMKIGVIMLVSVVLGVVANNVIKIA
jgi:hypothetical protein